MKKIITPIALLCLSSLPLVANASMNDILNCDSGKCNYVTLKGGLDQPTSDLGDNANMNNVKTTYTAGIAVGRKFMDMFGLELEYSHAGDRKYTNNSSYSMGGDPTRDSASSWKIKTDTLMANFSVDLLNEGKIRPYVKAGLGASRNKSNEYIVTDIYGINYTYDGKTKNSFAYQLGAGLSIASSSMFDVQFEYMYVDHGKVETASNYVQSSDSQVINSSPIKGRLKDHTFTIGIKYKF